MAKDLKATTSTNLLAKFKGILPSLHVRALTTFGVGACLAMTVGCPIPQKMVAHDLINPNHPYTAQTIIPTPSQQEPTASPVDSQSAAPYYLQIYNQLGGTAQENPEKFHELMRGYLLEVAEEANKLIAPTPDEPFKVLVIDNLFDPAHPVFQDMAYPPVVATPNVREQPDLFQQRASPQLEQKLWEQDLNSPSHKLISDNPSKFAHGTAVASMLANYGPDNVQIHMWDHGISRKVFSRLVQTLPAKAHEETAELEALLQHKGPVTDAMQRRERELLESLHQKLRLEMVAFSECSTKAAVDYAIDNNCQAINISWGSYLLGTHKWQSSLYQSVIEAGGRSLLPEEEYGLQDALQKAVQKGLLVVMSQPNELEPGDIYRYRHFTKQLNRSDYPGVIITAGEVDFDPRDGGFDLTSADVQTYNLNTHFVMDNGQYWVPSNEGACEDIEASGTSFVVPNMINCIAILHNKLVAEGQRPTMREVVEEHLEPQDFGPEGPDLKYGRGKLVNPNWGRATLQKRAFYERLPDYGKSNLFVNAVWIPIQNRTVRKSPEDFPPSAQILFRFMEETEQVCKLLGIGELIAECEGFDETIRRWQAQRVIGHTRVPGR